MNYSTLKKTAALSIVSLMAAATVNAQSSDSTKSASTSAKIFGGSGQYNTWTLGLNVGATSNMAVIGGVNNFSTLDIGLGGFLSLRKQVAHSFGIEGDFGVGQVKGTSSYPVLGTYATFPVYGFSTTYYSTGLLGVINVATVDFLRRENSVNFFVSLGYGLAAYAPKVTAANGTVTDWKDKAGDNHDKTYVKEAYIPVGAGVKFKVSDRVAFNLGYTMHFVDGDNLDGVYANGTTKDKFSYGYAGLEFSLGSKSKPDLEWVNPLALMYDELKDPSLRQEVEALKTRVSNVEKSVEDLKKDSDGDGVADQFDKCPGTPAGTAVDGSGCPLPKAEVVAPVSSNVTGFEPIQFEFNSSVLKTESYPILDKLSSGLRENGGKVTLKGYASSEGTAA